MEVIEFAGFWSSRQSRAPVSGPRVRAESVGVCGADRGRLPTYAMTALWAEERGSQINPRTIRLSSIDNTQTKLHIWIKLTAGVYHLIDKKR